MTSSGTHAHQITVSEPEIAVRVEIEGVVVAETARARVLHEGGLPPRYYVPRDDVRMDLLVATEHSTTCPFKGDASYWTLDLEHSRHENVVWSYEAPISSLPEIAELLCFYNERVDLVVDGEPAATEPGGGP